MGDLLSIESLRCILLRLNLLGGIDEVAMTVYFGVLFGAQGPGQFRKCLDIIRVDIFDVFFEDPYLFDEFFFAFPTALEFLFFDIELHPILI